MSARNKRAAKVLEGGFHAQQVRGFARSADAARNRAERRRAAKKRRVKREGGA